MNTHELPDTLSILMRELVHGSPDPKFGTYILNRGDVGLVDSLDTLSAQAASASSAGGGTIASHVDHLRYGLSLLNRWATGEVAPWKDADWTASWKKATVTESDWQLLRESLRREADAWIEVLRTPREMNEEETRWTAGTVAHLAYHMGAIRQIDRASRGPTAEDEVRATPPREAPAS
jgi:hypothetical protein